MDADAWAAADLVARWSGQVQDTVIPGEALNAQQAGGRGTCGDHLWAAGEECTLDPGTQ
ncbi:hypothetical protein ACH4ND_25935 [Streptomyces sp. NPDC017179]|uniref:hypothetical protein n=1 Tax=Streptomyces sp. NPDC017179 TaxID=3364979 RepID=UPI0037AD8781